MTKVYYNDTKYGKMMYKHDDFLTMYSLIHGNIFESEIIEKYLLHFIINSSVILDIGAHCGSHSVIYGFYNKHAKIHSFEPQKELFYILQENIKNNNIKNAMLYNIALGNKICNSTINMPFTNNNNIYNYGGAQIGIDGEIIHIKRLDDFNIENVDFIKIDTEYFENYIIDGGLNTIIKYKPVIFYEYHNELIDNKHMDTYYNPVNYTITEKLIELGYSIRYINNDNYLAIPYNQ